MLFAACDLEIPRRVQVSTTFGLHVPVGDIGELQEVKDALQYTNSEKISSLFDEETAVNVYYYTKEGYVIPMPDTNDENKNTGDPLGESNAIDPGKVRSMLLHFPLTSLNLDFSEYLNTDVTIPPVELPNLSSLPPVINSANPYVLTPIPIPLGNMGEWIKSITLNGSTDNTTVTLEGAAALKNSLEMAIPDFGIGDTNTFKQGVVVGVDLVFTATTEKKLLPKTTSTVDIYLQLTQVPPEGGSYPVKVDLKWTEAEVSPGDKGAYDGTIPLPIGQFSEVASKYKIVSIPCYLYVDGPFSNVNKVEIGLQADVDWLVGDKDKNKGIEITKGANYLELYQPSGDSYAGELHEGSASFNLAAKVNEDSASDLILKYSIKPGSTWTVKPGDADVISADMVVALPLQFNVEPQPEEKKQIGGKEYIDIFSMVKYGVDDNGDLFGRDQIQSTATYLSNVRLSGKNMKNTFFSNDLFLRILDEKSEIDELVEIKSGESFYADIAGSPRIPMPFHPEFSVCLHKPENEPAVIKIAPKPETGDDIFTVQISADVTGMAEHEQDL
jgi:hypothetical protein